MVPILLSLILENTLTCWGFGIDVSVMFRDEVFSSSAGLEGSFFLNKWFLFRSDVVTDFSVH